MEIDYVAWLGYTSTARLDDGEGDNRTGMDEGDGWRVTVQWSGTRWVEIRPEVQP